LQVRPSANISGLALNLSALRLAVNRRRWVTHFGLRRRLIDPRFNSATKAADKTRIAPRRPKQSAYPITVDCALMPAPTTFTARAMAAAGPAEPFARK